MRAFPIVFAVIFSASYACAQAPSNNSCSNALTVFNGVNPQPPNGTSGQFFTNVNATNSSASAFGVECAAAFNKDVWFSYTATVTGQYTIKTCTPSGFAAGTLSQTVVAVYDGAGCPSGGAAIACNDDSASCGAGSSRSSVNVNLWDGYQYLIRVGTESASASGTFYLTIDQPTTAANDTCLGAIALSLGANAGTFNGANGSTTTFGCPAFSADNADVWFTWSGNIFSAAFPKDVVITASDNSFTVDFMAIYSGTCGIIPPTSFTDIDCFNTQVSFVPGNDTYYIRVGRGFAVEPSLDFTLTVTSADVPDNDTCANGYTTFGGVQPSTSDAAALYSNVGATTSDFGTALSCVTNSNSDVWYDYIATASGKVSVSTDTPPGQAPGTLLDTKITVFASCVLTGPIACDDDSGTDLLSYLEFDAIQGTHYKIMVADFSPYQDEGTFWLSIIPKFHLAMTAPSGPTSLQLNLTDGGPFHSFFTCLTIQQGNYPYGPFFGIEPTSIEIALQITSGAAPFIGFMNGTGAYQFGPLTGLPTGLALYGVTLEFDAAGQIAGVSNYNNITIP